MTNAKPSTLLARDRSSWRRGSTAISPPRERSISESEGLFVVKKNIVVVFRSDYRMMFLLFEQNRHSRLEKRTAWFRVVRFVRKLLVFVSR